MKYRLDFVTNSSSSSFIIAKKDLSDDQLRAIRKHSKLGKELGIEWYEDEWLIDENETFITGSTYMDNFDFHEFFNIIDVDDDIVIWGDYPFDLIEDIEDINNEDSIKESKINWVDILNRLE